MINAETIKSANEGLAKVDVGHGKKYVMVTERIKAFREICPNGAIDTTILSMENGIVTIQAKIYDENDHLLASGLAQEKEKSSFINKTSYVENCETSAVGRALGMLGIGVDESMASAEEVANAIKNQNGSDSNAMPKAVSTSNSNASTKNECKALRQKIIAYGKEHGMSPQEIARDYKIGDDTPLDKLQEVYADLTKEESAKMQEQFAAIEEDVPWK